MSAPILCGIIFNSFGHRCDRERGHAGPHVHNSARAAAAEYEAEVYKQRRDARVARKVRP